MEILTKIGKFENVNLIKLASVGYFDENKGENHVLIELSLGSGNYIAFSRLLAEV